MVSVFVATHPLRLCQGCSWKCLLPLKLDGEGYPFFPLVIKQLLSGSGLWSVLEASLLEEEHFSYHSPICSESTTHPLSSLNRLEQSLLKLLFPTLMSANLLKSGVGLSPQLFLGALFCF